MNARDIRTLRVPTGLSEFHVQDAGPGAGPAVLLWPSLFTDGQTSWGAQLSGLHELGWRTLLVDPPGTGGTPSARRLFTLEECAEAAGKILDAAGVEKAAIVGLSWGGYVGLRLALAAPRRVRALVLSNSGARDVPPMRRLRNSLFARLIESGLIPGGPGRLAMPELISKHSRNESPALTAELVTTINSLDSAGLAHAVRSVLVKASSVTDRLHRIEAPTLVITGAQDAGLPPWYSSELAREIPGARLEVIPRVGHLSPREAPATVSRLIREFLLPLNTSATEQPIIPKGSTS